MILYLILFKSLLYFQISDLILSYFIYLAEIEAHNLKINRENLHLQSLDSYFKCFEKEGDEFIL